jgi:hypothetical protein
MKMGIGTVIAEWFLLAGSDKKVFGCPQNEV